MPQGQGNTGGFEFDAEFDPRYDAEPERDSPPGDVVGKGTPAPLTPGTGAQDARATVAPGGKDAAPKHSAMSVSFARDLGFTDDEIDAHTPGELDAAVRAAHKQLLRTSAQFRRNDIVERGGDQLPAPASSLPTRLDGTPAEPAADEDEYAEFRDVLHEDVIKAIQKGRKKDKATIEAMKTRLDEADKKERAAEQAKLYDTIDAEFGKMPAAVKAIIGAGVAKTLTRLQHAARVAILQEADADETAGLTYAQKMAKAAKALIPHDDAEPAEAEQGIAELYDETPPAPAKKPAPAQNPANGRFEKRPLAEREEAWQKGGTARPNQRDSQLPKGEKRALETARRVMIERGMLEDDDLPPGSFLPAASAN